MGSGKTTVGKKLAALFHSPFIDLDVYIEEQEQRSVPDIFAKSGESHFRKLETAALEKIIRDQSAFSVISLGGGSLCFNENLHRCKSRGLLIYLEMPAPALAARLQQNSHSRPLLAVNDGRDLNQKISDMLNEREPYYRQAHLSVSGINLEPKHLQQQILAYLQEHTSI